MKNGMGDIFGVLLLFFCMTVISLVMVFSRFEDAALDFWKGQEGLAEAVDALTENDIFDTDKTKTVGGVDEKGQNPTLSK